MSFAINTINNSCKQIEDPEFIKNHRGSLICDVFILTIIPIIAALILGGIIDVGIPIGIGTLGRNLLLGMIAGTGVIAAIDLTCLIKHGIRKSLVSVHANLSSPQQKSAVVTVASSKKKIFSIENLFFGKAPEFNFTEKLIKDVFLYLTTFLNVNDFCSLTQVNQYTYQLLKSQTTTKRALANLWFPLRKDQEDMIRKLGDGRFRRKIYLKLDREKKNIEYCLVDHYAFKYQIANTFLINCQVRKIDSDSRQLQMRFNGKIFKVEAREWRNDKCATWGEFLEPDEDLKIKQLFCHNYAI
jgi:hypothetical protein